MIRLHFSVNMKIIGVLCQTNRVGVSLALSLSLGFPENAFLKSTDVLLTTTSQYTYKYIAG
jgi:hypothetical protein